MYVTHEKEAFFNLENALCWRGEAGLGDKVARHYFTIAVRNLVRHKGLCPHQYRKARFQTIKI